MHPGGGVETYGIVSGKVVMHIFCQDTCRQMAHKDQEIGTHVGKRHTILSSPTNDDISKVVSMGTSRQVFYCRYMKQQPTDCIRKCIRNGFEVDCITSHFINCSAMFPHHCLHTSIASPQLETIFATPIAVTNTDPCHCFPTLPELGSGRGGQVRRNLLCITLTALAVFIAGREGCLTILTPPKKKLGSTRPGRRKAHRNYLQVGWLLELKGEGREY